MIAGLFWIGAGLLVLGSAIAADTLVAWAIRKWRASAWEDRQ